MSCCECGNAYPCFSDLMTLCGCADPITARVVPCGCEENCCGCCSSCRCR